VVIEVNKLFFASMFLRKEYLYIYRHLIADGQVTSPLLPEDALKNILLTKMGLQV
jgi:hypothetical protein